MAISPPGDIVLDVMRAADPERAEAARAQLQRFAPSSPASAGFAAQLDAAGARPRDDGEQAFQQFEAMVLGTFFQSMLPQDSSAVYGDGLSGEMWKSILAQHLGEAVSERGGIGIANHLLADVYRDGEQVLPLTGATDGPQQAALDLQNSLSQALVQELERRSTHSLVSTEASAHESGN